MLLTLLWQSCNALCLNSSAFRFSLAKVQYRINAIAKFSSCYWNYSTKKYEWDSQIMLEYTFTVKNIFFSGQWFKLKILCFKWMWTNDNKFTYLHVNCAWICIKTWIYTNTYSDFMKSAIESSFQKYKRCILPHQKCIFSTKKNQT